MNQMIDTNVKGVFYVTRAVVPGAFFMAASHLGSSRPAAGMIERKRGHIIMVSSIAGYQSYKNATIYAGSKCTPLLMCPSRPQAIR